MVAVLVGDGSVLSVARPFGLLNKKTTAVLAIRTWAVWNRNIRIGICLVFLQISSSVLYGVFVGNFKRQLVCELQKLYAATSVHRNRLGRAVPRISGLLFCAKYWQL